MVHRPETAAAEVRSFRRPTSSRVVPVICGALFFATFADLATSRPVALAGQAAAAPAAPRQGALPPLRDFGPLWNYRSEWIPRQWQEGVHVAGTAPEGRGWSLYRNLSDAGPKAPTVLRVTEEGGAGIYQAAAYFKRSFHAEMEFSVSKFRNGLIYAPMWFFNKPAEGAEIDFEVPGDRGLQINVRYKGRELGSRKIYDLKEGERVKIGVTARLPDSVVFFVNDREVARILPADMPGGVGLPNVSVGALASVWGYPNHGGWAGGPWSDIRHGEGPYEMTLYGYSLSDL